MNGPPGPPIGLIPFGGGIPGIPGIPGMPCIGNGGGNGMPFAGLPLKPPCGKGIGGKGGMPFGGGNGGIPRPGPPRPPGGGMNGGGRPESSVRLRLSCNKLRKATHHQKQKEEEVHQIQDWQLEVPLLALLVLLLRRKM